MDLSPVVSMPPDATIFSPLSHLYCEVMKSLQRNHRRYDGDGWSESHIFLEYPAPLNVACSEATAQFDSELLALPLYSCGRGDLGCRYMDGLHIEIF
jgi:hypothetical protein